MTPRTTPLPRFSTNGEPGTYNPPAPAARRCTSLVRPAYQKHMQPERCDNVSQPPSARDWLNQLPAWDRVRRNVSLVAGRQVASASIPHQALQAPLVTCDTPSCRPQPSALLQLDGEDQQQAAERQPDVTAQPQTLQSHRPCRDTSPQEPASGIAHPYQPSLVCSKNEDAITLRAATLADLDAITQHPERCNNVIQLRSRTALRQMVCDGEIDPDVARNERRTDWGLRCDVHRFLADIRLGTRTRLDVAADFASRGMPIRTAVRLLAKGQVAA